jgi:hypothetical protein
VVAAGGGKRRHTLGRRPRLALEAAGQGIEVPEQELVAGGPRGVKAADGLQLATGGLERVDPVELGDEVVEEVLGPVEPLQAAGPPAVDDQPGFDEAEQARCSPVDRLVVGVVEQEARPPRRPVEQ